MIDFKFQKSKSGKTRFLDGRAQAAQYKHKTLYVTNDYYDTKAKFKHYFKISVTNNNFEYVYKGYDGYSVFVFDDVKPPLDLLEYIRNNTDKFLFYRGTLYVSPSEFFSIHELEFFITYYPEVLI